MKTAKTFSLVAATAGLVLGAATASAAPMSKPSEFRGYQTCVKAAAKENRGMTVARNYYLNREGVKRLYYVNAHAWVDGEREALAIACTTSLGGHRLVSMDVSPGRFTNDKGSVRVEVASM